MALSINLAELLVDLRMDMSKFNSAVIAATSGLRRISTDADNTTKRVASTARVFISGISTGFDTLLIRLRWMAMYLGAAEVAAATFFGSFERYMARTRAITGATTEQYAALVDEARKVGRETVFTAKDAAEAMSVFAQQGLSVAEILVATRPTLDMAAAGMTDMRTAATIATGVMRGMRVEASQLARVVDVLAKISTTAPTDITSIGEAFKKVGPVAAEVGMSVEEVGAAIGTLSRAMIRGSEAGSQIRNILSRLVRQPGEVRKALDELGVSVEGEDGKMRLFADIIEDLRVKLADYSDTEREAMLANIGGLRAFSGLAVLVRAGKSGLDEYTDALRKAGGEAQRIANVQLDSLYGSFKYAQSAVEDLVIDLVSLLSPGLRTALDIVKDLANTFVEKVAPGIKKVIAGVIALTTALIGLTVVLMMLVRILLLLAMHPMVVFTAVITTVGGAILLLSQKGDTLAEKFVSLGKAARELALQSLPYLRRAIAGIVSVVAACVVTCGQLSKAVELVVTAVALAITGIWEDVKHLWSNLGTYFDWLKRNFWNLLDYIGTALGTALDNFGTNIADFFTAVKEQLTSLGTAKWSFTWTPLLEGFSANLEELPEITARAMTEAEEILQADLIALAGLWASQYGAERDRIMKFLTETGAGITKFFDDLSKNTENEAKEPGKKRRKRDLTAAEKKELRDVGTFVGLQELARKIQEAAAQRPDAAVEVAKKHLDVSKDSRNSLKDIQRTVKNMTPGLEIV